MKDLLYKDEVYKIYKKGVDELGTYLPIDCLNIIDIAINELSLFENGGFKEASDYKKVIRDIKKQLDGLLN
jgi:hypothetical protein